MKLIHSPHYAPPLPGHVFPSAKFALVAAAVRDMGELVEPGPPSRGDLLRAHDAAWIAKVIDGGMTLDDETRMELPWSREVSRAHLLQASGTILACAEALDTGLGLHVGGGSHHAFAGHGEGFCVLNDIACGLLKVLAEGRIGRAAVVDLDVHQGNGTASIFQGDGRVFTFSMHQEGIYPEAPVAGTLDVGFPAGTGDAAYLARLEECLPRVLASKPQLAVYQAGVDGAGGDLLGGLALTPAGLRSRDELVFRACRLAGVPVAVTLGGGYAARLEDTVSLHVQTLRGAAAAFGIS